MASLGERIKEIRNEHSLTQQQFAESISVSRPFISRVESGKENPSDSLLKLICATYNIKFGWIKTGVGDKQKVSPPYKELQAQILNPETLNLILENGNKQNYSFCLSVLMSILQNGKVKNGSEQFFIEQIKMILVSIDCYMKNYDLAGTSYEYSLQEEAELKIKLKKEFMANIEKYIDGAVQSIDKDNLNALLEE